MELNHYLFECNAREQMRLWHAEADQARLARLARVTVAAPVGRAWLAGLRDRLVARLDQIRPTAPRLRPQDTAAVELGCVQAAKTYR